MKKTIITTAFAVALTTVAVAAITPQQIVVRHFVADSLATATAISTVASSVASSVADSVAAPAPKPVRIQSQAYDEQGLAVVDTLPTDSEAVCVVLYNNRTWRYVRSHDTEKDATLYDRYWDTHNSHPYYGEEPTKMPSAVLIDLVDSVTRYHCPTLGKINPRNGFGMRHGRQHHGVDIAYATGTPVYAAFTGKVRISSYRPGYGNVVVIRHDNGLETYYGHLSKCLVDINQYVEAGEVIGLGGSTGRSAGPHLHFETRYYGQSFDPQRIINFETGELIGDNFLLRKSYFGRNSKAGQDFEDEVANVQDDKAEDEAIAKAKAEEEAKRYYKIRSGDVLGTIARRNGTTISAICRLNGIKPTTTLRIGRTLRVR